MGVRAWLRAFANENRKLVAFGASVLIVLWTVDMLPSVSLALEWRVLGTFLVVGVVVGHLAADFLDLEEEDVDWTVIKQINAADPNKIPEYELNPEAFEDLEVVGGELKHLPEHEEPTYECRYYDPEHNVAHVTWRGVPNGADLLGQRPGDLMEEIDAMRESYEQPVRWGSAIRNGLPAIIRSLEFERMRAQNQALDRHLTPEMGGRDIDELIAESIPDDALPDRLKSDDPPDDASTGSVSIDLEGDAIEPVGDLEVESGPVAGDD